MSFRNQRVIVTLIAVLLGLFAAAERSAAQSDTKTRVEEALQNITAIVRKGRIGYATIWDGNKYVQCRRQADRSLRCEAAGTVLQPSLHSVLTGERLSRLAAFGWTLDPSFGNYARTFAANVPDADVADALLQTLSEAYGADTASVEIETTWIADVPCPPRNGLSQNLAGVINDARSMRATAIRTCSYVAKPDATTKAQSVDQLVATYESTVTSEIQRLRINAARHVYVVFNAGIGYVQCMPDKQSGEIYCEAQSAESWSALESILTPERIAMLHKAGYADPGRAQNYWKDYPLDKYSDAALAREILTLLHEVYGYAGMPALKISTEIGG